MKVQEVMSTLVGMITPESSILDAANKMKDMNVGALPVCGKSGLIGMITDRDIVIRSSAEGRNPHIAPVESVMTTTINYVFEGDDIESAAVLMQRKQIRRLPVLNEKKMVVGILSLSDLASRWDCERAGETMKAICSGPAESCPKSPTLD